MCVGKYVDFFMEIYVVKSVDFFVHEISVGNSVDFFKLMKNWLVIP